MGYEMQSRARAGRAASGRGRAVAQSVRNEEVTVCFLVP
jgi:hypothetical protein